MGTIIVGAVLLLVVGLAVRSMIRDKKAGKSLQCGGDCKNCEAICTGRNRDHGYKQRVSASGKIAVYHLFPGNGLAGYRDL